MKITATNQFRGVDTTQWDDGDMHMALIKASASQIRKIPMETRVAMIDKLLQGWPSFDDQAAIVKLIAPDSSMPSDTEAVWLALFKNGLADLVYHTVQDHGRYGIGRDFPSETLSQTQLGQRGYRDLIATGSEELARLHESLGHSSVAVGIRGGTAQKITIEPPDINHNTSVQLRKDSQ